MGHIISDPDNLSRFARLYDRVADATENRRRVLRFDDAGLDRQLSAFGLTLPPGSWGSVGAAAGDIDRRLERVARHLYRSRDLISEHATKTAQADDFDWTSIFPAARGAARGMSDELFAGIELVFDYGQVAERTMHLLATGRPVGSLAAVATSTAHGLITGLSRGLPFLGLVEGAFDLLAPSQRPGFPGLVESAGDILKIVGAGAAILNPAGVVTSVGLAAAGIATDLVFENWDTVTDVWDSAMETTGGFVSDLTQNVLEAADTMWDETVEFGADFVGSLAAGFRFGTSLVTDAWQEVGDALETAGDHLADSWYELIGPPTFLPASPMAPPPGAVDVVVENNRELIEMEIRRLDSIFGQAGHLLDNLSKWSFDKGYGEHIAGLRWLAGQQVLHFDPAAGHVVVLNGDLGTATRVVVTVPGTSTRIANLAGINDPAADLQRQMGSEVAFITWLDYDNPTWLGDAAWMGNEFDSATPALDQFLRSLSQEGRSVILFGHSAGARVVQNQITDTDSAGLVDGVILSSTPDFAHDLPAKVGDRPVMVLHHQGDEIERTLRFRHHWDTFDYEYHEAPGKHDFGQYLRSFQDAIKVFIRRP